MKRQEYAGLASLFQGTQSVEAYKAEYLRIKATHDVTYRTAIYKCKKHARDY